MVLLLVLVGVLFAVFRSRPGKGQVPGKTAARADRTGSAETSEEDRSGSESPAASSAYIQLAGTLIASDDSPSIPLKRELLTSREGLVIGRAEELCHVQILDPQISRRHLRLRLANQAIWVEDLNSMKGTEVDGNRVEPFKPVRMHSGQSLRIAGISYRLDAPH